MTMARRSNLNVNIVNVISKFFFLYLLLMSLFGNNVEIYANELDFKIERTRIYVDGDQKKGFFTLINTGNTPIAISASLYEVSGDGGEGYRAKDFLVTPPTMVVGAKKKALFSIVRISEDLPKDRESLRYLKLQLLPGVKKNTGPVVTEAMVIYANVFYRPQVIVDPYALSVNCEKLKASKEQERLILTNPTPYWLILPSIVSNGKPLDIGTRAIRLPPYEQLGISNVPSGKLDIYCRKETGMSTKITVNIQ